MVEKEKIEIDLWADKNQYEKWKQMADTLCLNIYEYIRRCTDAHTNILTVDSFKLVPEESREGR